MNLKIKGIILITLMFTLTSCGSLFSPSSQNINIVRNNAKEVVSLNNITKSQDTFNITKDFALQLKFELDSHKTEYQILKPVGTTKIFDYNNYAAFALGLGLSAYIGDIPVGGGLTIFFVGGQYYMAHVSPQIYQYPDTIFIPKLKRYIYRNENQRKIIMDELPNIDYKKIRTTVFGSTSDYKNKEKKEEAFKLDTISLSKNTIYNVIEKKLEKTNFQDSTTTVFTDKFNNYYITAEILDFNLNMIETDKFGLFSCPLGSLIPEAKIKWSITNYYNDTIFQKEIYSLGGEFNASTVPKNYVSGEFWIRSTPYYLPVEIVEDIFLNSYLQFTETLKSNELLNTKQYVNESKKVNLNLTSNILPKNNDDLLETSLIIKIDDKKHGSGFIISNDGYFVTSKKHVYNNKNVKAIDFEGKSYTFEVINMNSKYDLALCKIDSKFKYALNLPTEKKGKTGSKVLAIGAPVSIELGQSISTGIISGFRQKDGYPNLIQIDSKINRGNKGGSLVDSEYNLLGILDYKFSGVGTEGLGFAVDALDIKQALGIE